jgi:hypothetical protein
VLSLKERLAVVNLYEELGSYRAVADLVGRDHKTVKAWLERERSGTAVRPRPRATDPYLPIIRAKVAAMQGKVKSKPLLRVLRAAGYSASLRVLPRALTEVRREWGREHRRIYRPWVSARGEFPIVDWGEVGTVPTAAGGRKLRASARCSAGAAGSTYASSPRSASRCSSRAWPAASTVCCV